MIRQGYLSVKYNGVTQWSLAYDANGNIASVTDSAGKSTSFGYDKNNRLAQKVEGTSNKMDFAYDANSNPTSLTITAGTTTVSHGFSYNPLDQLVSLSREGVSQAKFVYDERGNVTSVTYSNGTYTSYEYDAANRLKSVNNYKADGTLLDKYEYTNDANGNRTSVTTNSGTISYQYDALNQLIQETLLDGTTIAYEYDAVGNRTKKTVTQGGTPTTTNYTYDVGNQLTEVNGQGYTYDANGNLTSNGARTFIYNEENRLIEVKDSAGTSLAKFTYDHEGKRTSMTTASGTIYFHYSGNKVIYETDANNNIISEYTWDAKGNPVSMTKGGSSYYYHVNGHGDVTALTDANGTVVAEYQFDAWGNIISQTGTMASSNPYRYAGYRYDEVTGLYYLMARYYDASIGRFISSDSFAGNTNEPLSLNLYAYTKNNPVLYVDPNGHYYKRLDFSYDMYAAFRTDWVSFARFYVQFTWGGILGSSGTWLVGYAAAWAVTWWLTNKFEPTLRLWTSAFLAKVIIDHVKKQTSEALKNSGNVPRRWSNTPFYKILWEKKW